MKTRDELQAILNTIADTPLNLDDIDYDDAIETLRQFKLEAQSARWQTDAEYIAGSRCNCPRCGGDLDDLVVASPKRQVDSIDVDILCEGCRHSWTEHYTLTSITHEEEH